MRYLIGVQLLEQNRFDTHWIDFLGFVGQSCRSILNVGTRWAMNEVIRIGRGFIQIQAPRHLVC